MPDKLPPPPPLIPHGMPLTLDLAKRVAAAAEAEATGNGWPMAIAEPTGALVYFLKMDNTQYASVELAKAKAKTAAVYRRPTNRSRKRSPTAISSS
jgi:glc operon protein GlcG